MAAFNVSAPCVAPSGQCNDTTRPSSLATGVVNRSTSSASVRAASGDAHSNANRKSVSLRTVRERFILEA